MLLDAFYRNVLARVNLQKTSEKSTLILPTQIPINNVQWENEFYFYWIFGICMFRTGSNINAVFSVKGLCSLSISLTTEYLNPILQNILSISRVSRCKVVSSHSVVSVTRQIYRLFPH